MMKFTKLALITGSMIGVQSIGKASAFEKRKILGKPNLEMKCKKFDTANPADQMTNPLQGISWSYCITKNSDSSSYPKQLNSSDIMYVFHGASYNEYAWDIFGRNFFKTEKYPPTVIQISFFKEKTAEGLQLKAGKDNNLIKNISKLFYGNDVTQNYFLLTAKNKLSSKSGLLEVFIDQIIPYLENTPDIKFSRQKGKRFLLGSSMGGINALNLLLTRPDLFDKVIINAAAIFEKWPWHPKFMAYHSFLYPDPNESRADPFLPQNLYGEYFTQTYPPSESELENMNSIYNQDLNPFRKIKHLDKNPYSSKFPDVYFSVTYEDEMYRSNCLAYHLLKNKIASMNISSNIFFKMTHGQHLINLAINPIEPFRLTQFLIKPDFYTESTPIDKASCQTPTD